jgi:hypothetical protein
MQVQKVISARSLWIILLTTILTLVGVTFAAPKFIHWYVTPFLPQSSSGVSCAPSVLWAMEKLLMFQTGGLIAGFFLGIGLAYFFRKKSSVASS